MAVDDIRPVSSQNSMLDIKEERLATEVGGKSDTIHSGHFMVSRVHDVNNDDDDEEVSSPFNDDAKGFDFLSASREISTTYNFASTSSSAVSIDASLTKLFECMTLAYSGKITSPRWKQFRGLHLSQKQRIRLNNLIWREWHMQYIYGKLPMVCQFATPLSDDIHSKPEAVVLEGKYWKRRLDTVTAEYKKWRRYYKERVRQQFFINFRENVTMNEAELLDRVKEVTFIPHSSGSYMMSNTDLNLPPQDMMDMDFTNELFASLNQPFAFPNPRELSQLGCADLIQPGLVQLQPNLEEFMDIDTMQGQDHDPHQSSSVLPFVVTSTSSRKSAAHSLVEFFTGRIASFNSAFMPDTSSTVEMAQGGMQGSELTLEDFLTSSSPTSVPMSSGTSSLSESIGSSTSVGGNNSAATFLTGNVVSPQNITFQLTSDGQYQLDPTTIFLGPSSTQPTFTILPPGIYHNVAANTSVSVSQKQATTPTTITSELLHLLQQQQQPAEATVAPKKHFRQQSPTPIQPAPSLNQPHQHGQQHMFQQSLSSQSPLLAQSLSHQNRHPQQQQQQQGIAQSNHSPRKSTKINKVVQKQSGNSDSSSTGGTSALTAKLVAPVTNKKKDGPFAVPTAKPAIAPRKNRSIAPAPAPPTTPPQQSPASSSPSSPYLAQLLKNGTYPGALIKVKKEPQLPIVTSSPIKTTTNLYQQARASHSSAFSQQVTIPAVVTVATANQINLSGSSVDPPSITHQSLGNVILSSSASNSVSSSATKEATVRFSHDSDAKALSPLGLLSSSPVSSPQMVKRSPSPVPSMDTSCTMDPVSPFSSSMTMSPSSMGAPDSPGSSESAFPKDNRRAAHLSAEQKRRCNLKTGFDMLQQLVPSLSQNPKVSKATMLQKTAEYCKKLKSERVQMQKEAAILKQEIEALNSAISQVQSQLPETGVPVTRQRKDQMKEMFDEYVRLRTTDNWKFWIFSVIMNTLYDSYCNTVSTANIEELCRTSMTWLDQSCSLVTLRPNVLNALRRLSTSTSILTEPQKVKEQAMQAVSKSSKTHSNNMMTKH